MDEYQDTNHVQNRWAACSPESGSNLAVVGRRRPGHLLVARGGHRNILEFETQFPHGRSVKLEQNYRSTQNILSAAHAVVRHNTGRKEKRLWTAAGDGDPVYHFTGADERDEAAFVAREVERLVAEGLPDGTRLDYQDFAVLYRTHAQSRALEEAMVRRSIPYGIYGGLRFFERKEIKDVLAYLRIIANPSDTSRSARGGGAQAGHRPRLGGQAGGPRRAVAGACGHGRARLLHGSGPLGRLPAAHGGVRRADSRS